MSDRSSRVSPMRWLRLRFSSTAPRTDMGAALVVSALMVPQALGYASLAGVPVEGGLYAIPLALVAYALLGSSPHLIVGPVSTVSVLTGSILASRAIDQPSEAIAVAGALAVISGGFLIVAGLVRIGWVAEFLSKPIITGFVFGLSVAIVVGEIPVLLGLERVSGTGADRVKGIVDAIRDADGSTGLIGLGALVIVFIGGRWKPKVPWGLMVVVAALVLSHVADLSSRGVATVGAVPGGLPRPSIPDVNASEYRDLLVNGAAIALVGLAESLSAARLFAVRNGYRIRADREFIATGAANLAAALSGGFGVAGSLSKTATAEQSGGTSRLTGFTTAVIIFVVLLFFTSQLEELPLAILSAVVIQAVWGLMDTKALARYYRVRRNDFVAAVAALVGVLIFGTLPGLLLAVALSVLGLVYRSGRLDVDALGKVKGEKAAWGSLNRDPTHERIEGILVLRLSAPLFWVNAAGATVLVVDHLENNPGTHSVILDLEATDQLDITAADELGSLIRRLRRRGVDVYLVRVMHPARAVLGAAGVLSELGQDHMWRTISQGVRAARRAARAKQAESEVPNAATDPAADAAATDAATDAPQAERRSGS